MALSAAAHHTFDEVAAGETYNGLSAQKTDRAGKAAIKALRRQKSKAARDAVILELFDEDTAGVRPRVLAEPLPQERVRHTMEHIVDFICFAPMVQILDALVPQTVEQLPDVLRFFDTLTTSRLSKCPRSFLRMSLCARFCLTRSWRNSWCADDRILFLAAARYGAERRHSSSWSWRATRWSSRVQQRCMFLRNSFLSGLWSRSLISPLVEPSKIFAQDRVSFSSSHVPGRGHDCWYSLSAVLHLSVCGLALATGFPRGSLSRASSEVWSRVCSTALVELVNQLLLLHARCDCTDNHIRKSTNTPTHHAPPPPPLPPQHHRKTHF